MKQELMEKVKQLDKEIKEAMKDFGSYSYFDKGPEEVMFTDKWVQWIESLSREDAIAFGKYLIENDKKDGRYETFIEGALCNSMPDMWDEGIREQRVGIPVTAINIVDVVKKAIKQ